MEGVSSKCPGWSFLLEELEEKILAFIPFESVCTCRKVCRRWNDIFSSTKFITTRWAESPGNRNPWLVLIPSKVRDHCVAYCFHTHTWKKYCSSLSFLEEHLSDVVIDRLTCEGSTAGLLLARTIMINSKLNPLDKMGRLLGFYDPKMFRRVVCNPLTRKFFYLPAMSSIEAVMAIGIAAGEENTYKVMVVGRNKEDEIVEIYDSLEKSWRIVGHLPRNFLPLYLDNIVFSEGFSYCMTKDSAGHHIMGFCIRDGTFIFAPLPDVTGGEIWPSLIACGSRILVVGHIKNFVPNNIIGEKVIIWELEKVSVRLGLNSPSASSSLSWKEITRMPPFIWEDLCRKNKPWPWLLITGVGDYVCCKVKTDVIAYSLREESWIWLPQCPFEYSCGSVSSFGLRPDMNAI